MKIANESQWNTDDLESLVKAVYNHVISKPVTTDLSNFNPGLLLLFKTGKKKWGRSSHQLSRWYADYRKSRQHSDTAIVSIQTAKALEQPILDRIASVHSDKQDMHPSGIAKVASCIASALGFHNTIDKFKWAEEYPLRSKPKITRSPEAITRRIARLQSDQDHIRRSANRSVAKIQSRIDCLENKLSKLRQKN